MPISDVGLYLGGIETTGSGADQFLGAATALIDGPGSITGFAFRRRTLRLTVAVGAQRTIWLPGGLPVGTITVELDGDAYTDFETTEPFPHVRFLTVEDCGAFTIEYDVGSIGRSAGHREGRDVCGRWRCSGTTARRGRWTRS